MGAWSDSEGLQGAVPSESGQRTPGIIHYFENVAHPTLGGWANPGTAAMVWGCDGTNR
jgi:hypothetical protein